MLQNANPSQRSGNLVSMSEVSRMFKKAVDSQPIPQEEPDNLVAPSQVPEDED